MFMKSYEIGNQTANISQISALCVEYKHVAREKWGQHSPIFCRFGFMGMIKRTPERVHNAPEREMDSHPFQSLSTFHSCDFWILLAFCPLLPEFLAHSFPTPQDVFVNCLFSVPKLSMMVGKHPVIHHRFSTITYPDDDWMNMLDMSRSRSYLYFCSSYYHISSSFML